MGGAPGPAGRLVGFDVGADAEHPFLSRTGQLVFLVDEIVEFPAAVRARENEATDKAKKEAFEAQNQIAVIRLLFVWFIKEKGLVPEALFDPTELKALLNDEPASQRDSSTACPRGLISLSATRPMCGRRRSKDQKPALEGERRSLRRLCRHFDRFHRRRLFRSFLVCCLLITPLERYRHRQESWRLRNRGFGILRNLPTPGEQSGQADRDAPPAKNPIAAATKCPRKLRWAVDETGMNSANPSIAPKINALI